MPELRLRNQTTGRVLAPAARRAETVFARFVGVMGRNLKAGEAVGITRCDGVHTFGVRVPLDLAYCGADGTVLRVVDRLAPCRVGPRVRGTVIVWEMPGGTLAPFVVPGEKLIAEEKKD